MKDKLDKIHTERSTLTEKLKESLQEMTEENATLRQNINTRTKEVNDLTSTNKSLQNELHDAKTEVESLKQHTNSLQVDKKYSLNPIRTRLYQGFLLIKRVKHDNTCFPQSLTLY